MHGSRSRFVLIAGFGGLLLLMIFAGLDSIATLRQIQNANDEIREDFVRRTRILEQIRADVYVSGTYVRDYLLEPEAGKAEAHRASLRQVRSGMDAALGRYRAMLTAGEAKPFAILTDELKEYWRVLEPVLEWDAAKRRRDGYPFLRDDVYPRRVAMLAIADQIGGIDESQIQAGRERVETIFLRLTGRVAVTIALTVGLGLVLAAFTIRKILGLESATTANLVEISRAREELQRLSASIVAAQENERRSISRELHDQVGQALTGVLVELANLSNLIRAGDYSALSDKTAEIKREVESSIGVVRNMALLLRPSMLDDLGLVPALQWQAREVSKRSGIWVKVSAAGVDELPEEHKTCIYRVVQEALHNAVQHAAARNITVTVTQENSHLRLAIEDDGKGFQTQITKGMGILGMEERVSHLGGEFTLESEPGHGTTVHVDLPLGAAANSALPTEARV
jgi:signal transduction histidine kinase